MQHNTKRNVIIVICSIILLFYFVTFPWGLILTFGCIGAPEISIPLIRSAEFDFELKYSDNGVVKNIDGTYVCKYDGVDYSFGQNKKYIKWKSMVKGTQDEKILLKTINEKTLDSLGMKSDRTKVFFNPGNAGYFLGGAYDKPAEEIVVIGYDDSSKYNSYTVSHYNYEEIRDLYGIEILSFRIEPPIKNYFVYNGVIMLITFAILIIVIVGIKALKRRFMPSV